MTWTGEGYGQRTRFATMNSFFIASVLKEFELDSPDLPLDELGTHLNRKFSDVYHLDWRRFEEQVCDVFKQNGYNVVLTQATRDGGADILVFNNNATNLIAIVECKKYQPQKRLGVNIVRGVIGAMVDWDVRRAFIVTTTEFTSDAVLLAGSYKDKGFDIDLVGASELLTMLSVYNTNLPRLDQINHMMREEIIRNNRSQAKF